MIDDFAAACSLLVAVVWSKVGAQDISKRHLTQPQMLTIETPLWAALDIHLILLLELPQNRLLPSAVSRLRKAEYLYCSPLFFVLLSVIIYLRCVD